ncbi:MAG: hypothetical protein QM652_07690 [Legionella sp.]|uniref:hypothetical protein n=1 Tax=Legionella sp. TaxID=459 RepID=UPI0039E2EE17
MGKAQIIADKMNKLVQHGIDLTSDESQMHREAKKLYYQGSDAFKVYNEKLKPQVKATLESFLAELHGILDLDSESPYSKYPEHQCKFLDQCLELIKNYKNTLAAEPELWIQLKKSIHIFLDKIMVVVDDLTADFATEQYKLKITELKKYLENESN